MLWKVSDLEITKKQMDTNNNQLVETKKQSHRDKKNKQGTETNKTRNGQKNNGVGITQNSEGYEGTIRPNM